MQREVIKMSDIKSVLKMERLVFDKIFFERKGFKTDSTSNYTIQTRIQQNIDQEIYRVTLTLNGEKDKEYTFEIALTGYFSFDEESELDETQKNELIAKNTVAIMMPYMRSQVTLLTSQPETESVVLPAFNINNLLSEDK